MAKKNDKTELPKNVPIIKVRQQVVTKCGITCGGQGHEREKRWPPCGPSPPVSVDSNATCGLPDCYDEETCRCRCPCTLKEMMRMAAQPQTAQETPEQSVQTAPQLHLARIYTLEPKLYPREHIPWPKYLLERNSRRPVRCRPPPCRPAGVPPSTRNPFGSLHHAERRHFCGYTVSSIEKLF